MFVQQLIIINNYQYDTALNSLWGSYKVCKTSKLWIILPDSVTSCLAKDK